MTSQGFSCPADVSIHNSKLNHSPLYVKEAFPLV